MTRIDYIVHSVSTTSEQLLGFSLIVFAFYLVWVMFTMIYDAFKKDE